MINLGTQLFNLRKEKKLSVRELSEKVNLHRTKKIHFSNIAKYEKGEMNISLDIFTDLVKAMGMDVKTSVMFPKLELSIDELPVNYEGKKDLVRNKVVRIDGLRHLICSITPFNREYLSELNKKYPFGQAVLFIEDSKCLFPNILIRTAGKMQYFVHKDIDCWLPATHQVIRISTTDFDKLVDILDFYAEKKSEDDINNYYQILEHIIKGSPIEFNKTWKVYNEYRASKFYSKYGMQLKNAPEWRISDDNIERLSTNSYNSLLGDYEFEYHQYCKYLGEIEESV
jgi:transcriptional regulator with XRE-family HTH domain